MFNAQSDYALNKRDQEAIVCQSATDEPVRLTREDFASDEEFLKWKAWSDQDYHDTEKEGHIFYNHTLPLLDMPEKDVSIHSPEDNLIAVLDEQERQAIRHLLIEGIDSCLTKLQRRRLWLYCVENLTVRQIAEAENVRHQSIVECLAASKKKLQDFLKKAG